MDLSASTALVTGANRGFGRASPPNSRRGANVYAGARRPEKVDLPGIADRSTSPTWSRWPAPLKLASDVNMLVNNAGVPTRADTA